MSYARFSSEDYQCDVFVWDDVVGGLTICVAAMKRVFKAPLPPPVSFDADHAEAWVQRHHEVSRMVEEADLVPIGLPHDGETFNEKTAHACAERLKYLQALGYRVPWYAIDALSEEGTASNVPTPTNHSTEERINP